MLQPQKKPFETHYKNTYFLHSFDKHAYRRKLKDRFPPIAMLFAVTQEMHM